MVVEDIVNQLFEEIKKNQREIRLISSKYIMRDIRKELSTQDYFDYYRAKAELCLIAYMNSSKENGGVCWKKYNTASQMKDKLHKELSQ